MKYELIRVEDVTILNHIVNQKLAEGWSLYGPPFEDSRWFFCQAVTYVQN